MQASPKYLSTSTKMREKGQPKFSFYFATLKETLEDVALLSDNKGSQDSDPAGNYIFKVNNKNTRTRCVICSKLTIKTPERHHWCRSGVFIVNFEHISHLVLAFLWLTLSR